MAEDTIISLVFEFLWTLIRFHYEVVKGIIRWLFPTEKDITGEIVLITGAGHGMGREMALRFARLGAIVVSVDINPAGNEETYKMVKEEKGRIYKFECDVTDRAAVMALAQRVKKDVGEVSILVNNAGIMPCNPILQQTEKEIRLLNDLNINGNIWMIQAFLPSMIERNHGHIVAMSSMAGLMGLGNLVPYCGSKYAVRGLMDALAAELHEDPRDLSGIKFTTIFPYIVDTGLCKKPRIRFQKVMKIVDPGEAADIIIDSVRKELMEVTIPKDLHYMNRYVYRLIPYNAACVWQDFFNTGCDAHN
ncbi:epidermal retinol dehydrogenase 2-like isoform X2 [Epargyreus clarus]|uniref:epidermal retinol dehydrogenase 2-like isoform X2 n=1 Tax=Epargyreus clarus TaxID=520877 RepID=UPI003C2B8D8E